METVYKVGVCVPEGFLDAIMDAVTEVVVPIYPGYDRVFSYWPVRGTWRPLEGSEPYMGRVGEIETADEIRLEFAVDPEHLCGAVDAIRMHHPYEEPAIDIVPMIAWKSVTASDGI